MGFTRGNQGRSSAISRVERFILGVDPGTNHYSAALLNFAGEEIKLLALYTYQYNPKKTLEYKLRALYNDASTFLKTISPDVAIIEAQYFGGNARTLRSLCESVGVLKIAINLHSNAEIKDYTPNEIKLAFTGYGKASKEDMILQVYELFGKRVTSDEADAIGVGVSYVILDCMSKDFSRARKKLLEQFKKEKLSSSDRYVHYREFLKEHFAFKPS